MLFFCAPVQTLHFRSLMWSPPYSPPFSFILWTDINRRFKHATSPFSPAWTYIFYSYLRHQKPQEYVFVCMRMFNIQKETAQQASHHLLLLFIRKYQQVCRHVAFLFLLFPSLSYLTYAMCSLWYQHIKNIVWHTLKLVAVVVVCLLHQFLSLMQAASRKLVIVRRWSDKNSIKLSVFTELPGYDFSLSD